MLAVILAGGKGTRPKPFTMTSPKPLLPLGDVPIVEVVLQQLTATGVWRVVIALGHMAHLFAASIGNGDAFGVKITYSVEETILGTAGGMKNVEHLFSGPLIVVYGDVLTDMDLAGLVEYHQTQGLQPHVTLSLCRVPNPWECGVVGVDDDNRVTRFAEKPSKEEAFSDLVNAGVLVMDRQMLDFVPELGFSDISHDLLPELLRREVPIYAQPIDWQRFASQQNAMCTSFQVLHTQLPATSNSFIILE